MAVIGIGYYLPYNVVRFAGAASAENELHSRFLIEGAGVHIIEIVLEDKARFTVTQFEVVDHIVRVNVILGTNCVNVHFVGEKKCAGNYMFGASPLQKPPPHGTPPPIMQHIHTFLQCINGVIQQHFCIYIHSMQVLTPYYTTLYTFYFITIR